jgi:hypothetical protein
VDEFAAWEGYGVVGFCFCRNFVRLGIRLIREVSILSGSKLGLEIILIDGGVVVEWSGDGFFLCADRGVGGEIWWYL